jgi:hypothetical protein
VHATGGPALRAIEALCAVERQTGGPVLLVRLCRARQREDDTNTGPDLHGGGPCDRYRDAYREWRSGRALETDGGTPWPRHAQRPGSRATSGQSARRCSLEPTGARPRSPRCPNSAAAVGPRGRQLLRRTAAPMTAFPKAASPQTRAPTESGRPSGPTARTSPEPSAACARTQAGPGPLTPAIQPSPHAPPAARRDAPAMTTAGRRGRPANRPPQNPREVGCTASSQFWACSW